MIQSQTGRKKGIWIVFLCQFIFTTSKSHPLVFCCKDVDREIYLGNKETEKMERKGTEEESGMKTDQAICENVIYLGVGQSEANFCCCSL